MKIRKLIGQNLRVQRKLANLSLEDLARHLNCSMQTISKYENGTIKISAENLTILTWLIKCPITSIIPQEPSKPDYSSEQSTEPKGS